MKNQQALIPVVVIPRRTWGIDIRFLPVWEHSLFC